MIKAERTWGAVLTLALLACTAGTGFGAEAPTPTDEELKGRFKEVQAFLQSKLRSVEGEINELFQVNFPELQKEFQAKTNDYNLKFSILNKIQDAQERNRKLKELSNEYQDERLYRYIEAASYFENEVEKDHRFVGELLARLEELLDIVVRKDLIFSYAFHSKEFKDRYGLVLKRVVWGSTTLQNVSAETTLLNVHAVFGDKAKIPSLIQFKPVAFHSLAFLRTLLIHELNHVCMYKDPRFFDVRKFEGTAVRSAQGPYSHYFRTLSPVSPAYQYQLIHEYYSFKTQILFDERIAARQPELRLDAANRKNVEGMLEWTYSQLNEQNREFVRENPDPPILTIIERFYGEAAA